MTILLQSPYEVSAMNDEKEKRPDPKVLNAVIAGYNLLKGVYNKTKEEQDEPADKCEKGNENESNHR